MKLDLPLAQALTNLRGSPDFKVFVSALQDMSEAELQKSLSQTDLLFVGRAQGRAMILQEVLLAVSKAPETLVKLKP